MRNVCNRLVLTKRPLKPFSITSLFTDGLKVDQGHGDERSHTIDEFNHQEMRANIQS
jgi:hypothetical protein